MKNNISRRRFDLDQRIQINGFKCGPGHFQVRPIRNSFSHTSISQGSDLFEEKKVFFQNICQKWYTFPSLFHQNLFINITLNVFLFFYFPLFKGCPLEIFLEDRIRKQIMTDPQRCLEEVPGQLNSLSVLTHRLHHHHSFLGVKTFSSIFRKKLKRS